MLDDFVKLGTGPAQCKRVPCCVLMSCVHNHICMLRSPSVTIKIETGNQMQIAKQCHNNTTAAAAIAFLQNNTMMSDEASKKTGQQNNINTSPLSDSFSFWVLNYIIQLYRERETERDNISFYIGEMLVRNFGATGIT